MTGNPLDRRAFLRLAGCAAGAAFFPGAVARAWSPAQRVVVIGAGLAGLTAAYELHRHGHRVTVLEARQRVGGRVFTLHNLFHGRLYAELGGEWIHPQDHYIRHYVEEFGLELLPDEGSLALWENGALRPFAEAEKAIPGYAELDARLDEHLARINIFENPAQSALARLDALSYLDFLRSLEASPAAIAHERITVNDLMTVDIHEISALHMLYEYGLPRPETTDFRIRGGNSLLPGALARRLGERVRLDAAVTAVEWDARGARVRYLREATPDVADADHVVVAIPGTLVRGLRFTPALPEETGAAYGALGYGRILKVAHQARQRFWDQAALPCKAVFTHREADYVYDASRGQPGMRGVISCYVAGWGADRWAPLRLRERLAAARKLIGEIWPGAPAQLERGYSRVWTRQEWTRGSYAYFAPGQMTRVRPILSQPVGRIHFAGEHTAVWQGYMNGAVESGLRAAAEIEPAVAPLFHRLTQPGTCDLELATYSRPGSG